MPNTTNHIPALLYTRRLRELADKMMVRDGRHICGVRDNLDHHSFVVGWVEGQRDAAGEFKKTIIESEREIMKTNERRV